MGSVMCLTNLIFCLPVLGFFVCLFGWLVGWLVFGLGFFFCFCFFGFFVFFGFFEGGGWVFGFWFFQDRVSLCSPGCPGTHSVEQDGLELRNPPASASQSWDYRMHATTAQLLVCFFKTRSYCETLAVLELTM